MWKINRFLQGKSRDMKPIKFYYDYIKYFGVRKLVSEIVKNIGIKIYPNTEEYNNIYNYTEDDILKNKKIIEKWNETESKTINSITWFVPAFYTPFAGIYTILEYVNFFASKDIIQNLVLVGDNVAIEYCKNLLKNNTAITIYNETQLNDLPYTDIGIATSWGTAYYLLRFNNTKGKFYFIQDDERLHNPIGLEYMLAEQTYRFGFIGITNAKCLKEMVIKEFGGRAKNYYYTSKIYKPKEHKNKEWKLCFYSRPDNPRNGFNLGIEGLKEIHKRHPDVKIVNSGQKTERLKEKYITQLGKLSPKELQEFYAGCDVGIYIVFSRHTGIIPFDLMMCGCAVLTNKRFYNETDLINMENCIMFEPTPSSIADCFDLIYNDRKIYKRIVDNGLKFTDSIPSIESEMNKIFNFMKNKYM